MDEKLKKIIDEYCDAFFNQEKVKKYLALEKSINNSKEIIEKQNNLKTAQKKLALSISDTKKHSQALIDYNKAKKDFDEDPLIVNYQLIKEDILNDIKRLKEKLDS